METTRELAVARRDDRSGTGAGPGGHMEGPEAGAREASVALTIFHLIERALLIVVVLMTVGGAGFEIWKVWENRTITLADILLIFLYLEVIGMVAVFYAERQSVFVYPIFIAITALARLIILQGKEMAPENILFEAVAILILSVAAMIILRLRQE
ncbi:phosphate-starvation-inducible protein PsiE [Oceaniglobus roseus]|uniref:phosphate-starvation-inducible protein PsiE n=1 Tax=Oceaniglobus roseus TaxID=1737570 RepID=UPI001FEBA7C4|nr:phosphate-starvation-inducible PsiE family protein [Kandeliimicrobium roseum]